MYDGRREGEKLGNMVGRGRESGKGGMEETGKAARTERMKGEMKELMTENERRKEGSEQEKVK